MSLWLSPPHVWMLKQRLLKLLGEKLGEGEGGNLMKKVGEIKTIFDELGRVPAPFKAVSVEATNSKDAEIDFRRYHGPEWQIDEIKVNKFCAMVIYHHYKDLTR